MVAGERNGEFLYGRLRSVKSALMGAGNSASYPAEVAFTTVPAFFAEGKGTVANIPLLYNFNYILAFPNLL